MYSNELYYSEFNNDSPDNPKDSSFDKDPLNEYCTEEDFESIWGDGLLTAWYYYDENDAYFSDEIEGKAREEFLLEVEIKKYGNEPPMSVLFNESDFEWDYDMEHEK